MKRNRTWRMLALMAALMMAASMGTACSQSKTAEVKETTAAAAEETTKAAEETTAAAEETTEAAEETTAAAEETTEAAEETTAAAEETTEAAEETTAAAEETTEAAEETTAAAEETPEAAEETTAAAEETTEAAEETTAAPLEDPGMPDFSAGLDAEGWLEDASLTGLATLPDYKNATFARSDVEASDEEVQSQIDSLLASYPVKNQITDRAVEDGDTVNIDYIGRIDGEEFSGGNTQGSGTEVTIGVTQYIDDFLEQLIGHTPGETFDVNVTFPEDYGVEELNGKDAVFETTINYISETLDAEWNDAFVAENLAESYGYESAADAEEKIRKSIRQNKVFGTVWNWLLNETTFSENPDSQTEKQLEIAVAYERRMAYMYGLDFETYLTYMGVESEDALRENNRPSAEQAAKQQVITQLIAEAERIEVEDAYMEEMLGAENIESYTDFYGPGYIYMNLRMSQIPDWIVDHATLTDEPETTEAAEETTEAAEETTEAAAEETTEAAEETTEAAAEETTEAAAEETTEAAEETTEAAETETAEESTAE